MKRSILTETWETLVPELVQLLFFFSLLVFRMDILLPTSAWGAAGGQRSSKRVEGPVLWLCFVPGAHSFRGRLVSTVV